MFKAHQNNLGLAFLEYPEKRLKCKRSKKALSEIISYVILIVIALGVSVVVYQWMSVSTPSISETCSEDVSLYVKSYNCYEYVTTPPNMKMLNITLKNNGNFNIDGIYIRTSNDTQSIPTAGIKCWDCSDSDLFIENGRINFNGLSSFNPGREIPLEFEYTIKNKIIKIQIEPFVESKNSLQICSDATINIEVDVSKRCS